MTSVPLRALVLLVSLLGLVGSGAPLVAAEKLSLEQLRVERRKMAERPRQIIMNNDGCDALYYPKSEPVTVPYFLAMRTTPLAGTQVGAIAYCSISAGFGNFTHNTQVGTLLTRSGEENGYQPDTHNVAKALIDGGTDCLQAVVDFGHRSGMEVFWSMRMNDTHDAAHHPDRPYFLFPPLKVEHPEWLVGNPTDRTPFGRWSSVDYAVPEIRNLAFGYVEEVCDNYDVDGVELDFFRHLCYFKSTATGGKASDQERAVMTDLVRRIRKMTEERGLERGRPILLTIRVPDSVGYCRDMGFDIEKWLQDGLVDILITTCYFRLNPWEYSVELGHKYGVQVYPCLSDSRVVGETRFRRAALETYRGRALNAWKAGADGIHVFNNFDPKSAIWRELGDPDGLLTKNKLYFVHVRDDDPRRFLAGGREYQSVEMLGPSHERQVKAGSPLEVEMVVGDDLAAAQSRGARPAVQLHVEAPGVSSTAQLAVSVNGTALAGGVLKDGWIDYPVPATAVRCGKNQVEIQAAAAPARDDGWGIVFDGGKKPGKGWQRDPGSERTAEESADGTLLIADRGDVSGDYLYYRHSWGADPAGKAVVEAEVKVKSGSSFVIVSNGTSGERLGLWPDRIELFHNKNARYAMDTTSDFHLYRLEIDGADLKVFVDGKPAIDASGALKARSGYDRNDVSFGAANSGMMGEAYWKAVRASSTGLVCRDLVISVLYAD
ncbi:MAG: glycoside hydrolase family 10 protein [Thermoguttaceae bacterium]